MPTVIELIQRERQAGNGALIDECWRRGVVGGEPDWFYAHQNGCSVGVPPAAFVRDPNMAAMAAMFPDSAVLMLKGRMCTPPEPKAEEPLPLTARQRQGREIVAGNISSTLKEREHGAN